MALFKFQNNNKHGNLRTRIVHSPTSQFSFKPRGLGKFVNVQRFYYEMEHATLSPILFKDQKGNKIMMPDGIKVHPKTTLDDIKIIRPKKLKRKEPIIEIHTSSSSGAEYTTKYHPDSGNFRCTCMGYWRAKDRRCKHIKSMELKLKK